MQGQAWAYDKVDDQNDHEGIPLRSGAQVIRAQHKELRSAGVAIKAFMIVKDLTLLILSLFAIGVLLRAQNGPSTKPCDCGRSTTEARQQGCEYDAMAAAWLPPHCIDKELLAEFEKAGDGPGGQWQYWADANHTYEYSTEEVAQLADTPGKLFHTTPAWHAGHCFFYWRKIQRSKHTGVTIERRYDNERHTKHCGEVFKNPGHTAYSYVELTSSNTEPPEFVKHLMVDG
ncbi:hypothetical protein F4678DRAFT_463389 [Xylaria arbuscula]|nr:hypothetical protein F4678DRAFT_463389 [Xylaria arbuscula]